MSIFKEPLLICEAGLHADGDVEYYLEMVRTIQGWWPGWPRLAFKVQVYTVPSELRVMKSISLADLFCRLVPAVHKAGMLMAVTPHDVDSMPIAKEGREPVDILKLGSFGAASPVMRDAAYKTGLPLILSTGITGIASNGASHKMSSDGRVSTAAYENILHEVHRKAQNEVSFLQCVSAYPANVEWDSAKEGGYSCHCVPGNGMHNSIQAAKLGCRLIEIHVTNRPAHARPQPKDYCVSLSMDDFRLVANTLGSIWSAEPLVVSK